MPRVILTGSICQHVGGLGSIEVAGATAREAIAGLEASYPALRGWVVDEQGARNGALNDDVRRRLECIEVIVTREAEAVAQVEGRRQRRPAAVPQAIAAGVERAAIELETSDRRTRDQRRAGAHRRRPRQEDALEANHEIRDAWIPRDDRPEPQRRGQLDNRALIA